MDIPCLRATDVRLLLLSISLSITYFLVIGVDFSFLFWPSWDMTAHVKKQPMCRIDLLTSFWLKSMQCLMFQEKDMKSFHCMSHLSEVFASRDREKVYYIAGVLVIRVPSYAKFFCLNRVSKFKGPRKSVLHSGRPSYLVYHLFRVYCISL